MNYLQINELCQNHFPDLMPSELAGMLHGLLGHGFVVEEGRWQQQMSEFLTSGEPMGYEAEKALEQLLAFTQKDYQADSFSIDLLIPEDDYPLEQRAKAIGEWCQGYLTGYGLVKQSKTLSGDAQEAIQDLSEISKIEFDLEEQDAEELESAFVTIAEHVKMSSQIIFMANQPKTTVVEEHPQVH
ncbi:MAG: UPF0149 family protein [Kangiellaceae bacterium]|nr:UPF0149 family protein [Kangiellaceae bacterium]